MATFNFEILYFLKSCPIFEGPTLCQFTKYSNFQFFDKINLILYPSPEFFTTSIKGFKESTSQCSKWLSNIWNWKANLAGCCKQTFDFQFNIKLVQSKTCFFFQFSQNGRKNSNFFTLAVLWSDSIKWNYVRGLYLYNIFSSQISTGQSPNKAFRMYTKIKPELKAKQKHCHTKLFKVYFNFCKIKSCWPRYW